MDEASKAPGSPGGSEGFPPTLWSVVLAAGDSRCPGSLGALERLCRAYWKPLFVFVRCQGYAPAEAQDLTQGFFAEVIEGGWIGRADPGRGRFRSFLLGSIKNHISNQRRRDGALKRGGGSHPISIDAEEAEGIDLELEGTETSPEVAYDRRWARTLVARAVSRLRCEVDEAGPGRFERLNPFLLGVPPGDSFAALAERSGVGVGAAKSAVFRLRRRFIEVVRAEVAGTVREPGEVDGELRYLFSVLSG